MAENCMARLLTRVRLVLPLNKISRKISDLIFSPPDSASRTPSTPISTGIIPPTIPPPPPTPGGTPPLTQSALPNNYTLPQVTVYSPPATPSPLPRYTSGIIPATLFPWVTTTSGPTTLPLYPPPSNTAADPKAATLVTPVDALLIPAKSGPPDPLAGPNAVHGSTVLDYYSRINKPIFRLAQLTRKSANAAAIPYTKIPVESPILHLLDMSDVNLLDEPIPTALLYPPSIRNKGHTPRQSYGGILNLEGTGATAVPLSPVLESVISDPFGIPHAVQLSKALDYYVRTNKSTFRPARSTRESVAIANTTAMPHTKIPAESPTLLKFDIPEVNLLDEAIPAAMLRLPPTTNKGNTLIQPPAITAPEATVATPVNPSLKYNRNLADPLVLPEADLIPKAQDHRARIDDLKFRVTQLKCLSALVPKPTATPHYVTPAESPKLLTHNMPEVDLMAEPIPAALRCPSGHLNGGYTPLPVAPSANTAHPGAPPNDHRGSLLVEKVQKENVEQNHSPSVKDPNLIPRTITPLNATAIPDLTDILKRLRQLKTTASHPEAVEKLITRITQIPPGATYNPVGLGDIQKRLRQIPSGRKPVPDTADIIQRLQKHKAISSHPEVIEKFIARIAQIPPGATYSQTGLAGIRKRLSGIASGRKPVPDLSDIMERLRRHRARSSSPATIDAFLARLAQIPLGASFSRIGLESIRQRLRRVSGTQQLTGVGLFDIGACLGGIIL
ncbi:hypothetical protein H4R33_001868 [Dimargaris cristalligena]|nr:hypothetical protein H4R33_001868 [Dimargaris cristalligena]